MSLSDKRKKESNGAYDNSNSKLIYYEKDVKEALKELLDSGVHDIKVPQTIKLEWDKIKEIFGEELINSPVIPEPQGAQVEDTRKGKCSVCGGYHKGKWLRNKEEIKK